MCSRRTRDAGKSLCWFARLGRGARRIVGVVHDCDLLKTIGRTPIVELAHFSPSPDVRLFAKLEGWNPTGSVKDRIVREIVREAERSGALKPGDVIVEASTGNTGIA